MYDQHPCDPSYRVTDCQTGDIICSACGEVVQQRIIDERAPWRNHEDGDDKATAGGPLSVRDQLLDGGGLPSTGISSGRWNARQDASANSKRQSVAAGLNQTLRRTPRSLKQDRNSKALGEISEIVAQLGLPTNVEEKAMVLFTKFVKVSPTRKKNLRPYVAAAVYLACRERNATRAVREIAAATSVDAKELGRKFKEMQQRLKEEMDVKTGVQSMDFMDRYCQHLELTQQTTADCNEVMRRTMGSGIAEGKSPISIAAAAIFMVTQHLHDEKRTEKQIMDVTQVSEPTLRAVYKLLREHKDQLLPDTLRDSAGHLARQSSPDPSPSSSPYSYSAGSALASPTTVGPSPGSLSPSPPSSPVSTRTASASSSFAVESPQPRPVVVVPATPAIAPTPADQELVVALQQQQHDTLDYLLSAPPIPFLGDVAVMPEFGNDPTAAASSTLYYQPSLLETAYELYQQHT